MIKFKNSEINRAIEQSIINYNEDILSAHLTPEEKEEAYYSYLLGLNRGFFEDSDNKLIVENDQGFEITNNLRIFLRTKEPKSTSPKLPKIDPKKGIPKEILEIYDGLSIVMLEDMLPSWNQSFIEELKTLVKNINISSLNINIHLPLRQRNLKTIDLSILHEMPEDLSELVITGIDLSDLDPKIFQRFKNLKEIELNKSNLSDFKLVQNLNPDTEIIFCNNPVKAEHLQYLIDLAAKHENFHFQTDDNYLLGIWNNLACSQLYLNQFLDLYTKIDFSKMKSLKIMLDDSFNRENLDKEAILKSFSSLENLTLETNMQRYGEFLKQFNLSPNTSFPVSLVIKDISQLTFEQLFNMPNVQSISIQDGDNTEKHQEAPYSRDDFLAIRTELDILLADISPIDNHTKNNDLQVFAKIYKKLSQHIIYDYYAISEKGELDKELQTTCRNLHGALLDGKAVCGGYADALRNALACVGIESRSIFADKKQIREVLSDSKDDAGHVWNQVKLGDEWYNVDLTWDRDSVLREYPLDFFLKSDFDFGHTEYNTQNIPNKEKCYKSLETKNQRDLFDFPFKTLLEALDEIKENVETWADKQLSFDDLLEAHYFLEEEKVKEIEEEREI